MGLYDRGCKEEVESVSDDREMVTITVERVLSEGSVDIRLSGGVLSPHAARNYLLNPGDTVTVEAPWRWGGLARFKRWRNRRRGS